MIGQECTLETVQSKLSKASVLIGAFLIPSGAIEGPSGEG